ncbi:MAG TPA: c-type cytochrome [Flavobacteriaceae bacterium]|nr:c-type cytochrome [Flavobacteriaceae bacterium]
MKKVKFRHSVLKVLLVSAILFVSCSTLSYGQEDANASQETAASADASSSDLGDPEKGKSLFNANCAACHRPYKKMTGPALHGITERMDKQWIYDWIHNSTAMIEAGDPEAVAIFEEYNKMPMPPFPQLSKKDIDDILAYVEQPKPEPAAAAAAPAGTQTSEDGGGMSGNVILGILAFVLIVLVAILFLVNKTLNRFAEENNVPVVIEEKRKPLWKAFIENQFLVLVSAVVFLLAAAYLAFGWMFQIGVDQGYQPIQPIHFSHRIHAGDNQIDCKYCHSSARTSKVSGVPSLNVCMNCHVTISEVAPETATEEHSKEYYDAQIAKLYAATGWDPAEQDYVNEPKPVKWIRVHNLPDFAYYNHSQHVSVAGIQCQKCHGPVEEMEVLYQYAPLTMGWCVNCHRETNVKMEGNEYYEQIHAELAKKYGVEKVTIAELGGIECGKCHY